MTRHCTLSCLVLFVPALVIKRITEIKLRTPLFSTYRIFILFQASVLHLLVFFYDVNKNLGFFTMFCPSDRD
ncbi:hypothetical protein C0J52_23884 [Blattella germanica]|nr:hypothetical protein C0J52_23884 [Blattella germanica]